MDKLVWDAFLKLEKWEHRLRAAREKRALGRITPEQYRKDSAAIMERYQLSPQEEAAVEKQMAIRQQRWELRQRKGK